MHLTFIQRIFKIAGQQERPSNVVHDPVRLVWDALGYLQVMNTERLSGLGLEPVITTSELADYLGVQVQAIYDLRNDGRGPTGIRVGREIRYRVSAARQDNADGGPTASAGQHVRRDQDRASRSRTFSRLDPLPGLGRSNPTSDRHRVESRRGGIRAQSGPCAANTHR
ncbi:helix-turn-helix domain-containing protein [Mycetocola sp. 2940]|uniref:helix-turn-helix transcriptional regulator n=1 Tax=Mycetocola sp. 2940 TaxID=3156452 RepID=UPI003393CAE0